MRNSLCLAKFAVAIIRGIASGMDAKIQVARAMVVIFILSENIKRRKTVMRLGVFCREPVTNNLASFRIASKSTK